MPTIGEMKPSKFLTKEFIGSGRTLTVKKVDQFNVAPDDQAPELKWCLVFESLDKPLPLNSTMLDQAAALFGSDNSDNWTGKRVHVWVDPSIMFGGKKVGGLRLKEPQV